MEELGMEIHSMLMGASLVMYAGFAVQEKKRGEGKVKLHLPVGFWEGLFKEVDEKEISLEVVRRALGLTKSTFYRKRKQYLEGGVLPRKPGSGRPRIYLPEQYEPLIREVLKEMPPTAGHKRIWMALKRRGIPYSQGTHYRIMKDLGLLVPQRKGRSKKHFKALRVEGPGHLWVVDTTTWWIGNKRVEIYVAIDAYSRWIPRAVVAPDRTGVSTIGFYALALQQEVPVAIHTDNGTEFANRNAIAYLKENRVQWMHGPSHTPEAQGLVERVNRTMKEEWLMWREPRNIDELQETIDEFVEWYNTNREHSSLDYKVPSEVHYATT
jgi:putative transposase